MPLTVRWSSLHAGGPISFSANLAEVLRASPAGDFDLSHFQLIETKFCALLLYCKFNLCGD